MNQNLQQIYDISGGTAVRNRVLRNTYWLLALSLIPTVMGAWMGVQFNINVFALGFWPGLILFFALSFGFMIGIQKNKDSGLGVALLLLFTLFMGTMLSGLLGRTLRFSNGPTLIMLAFSGTAVIMAAMATIATVSKRDFSKMGQWLFMGVIVLFVASLANIFLQIPALYLALSVMAIVIFSAYLLYDVNQIVTGGETNYVIATLQIYLDLFNIFQNLLSLLGIFGGDD
ncbi:MAG: Bax inhibitor-1 family protein [Burkholderiales bacterium]|nr:Bax inhibitor-1 family protein [Burkholderiales bacterium]